MNAQRATSFSDACSRAHSKPAPLRLAVHPQRRARPVAPLDRPAARLQRVTFPYPAAPGARPSFWSMAYRGELVENAALVLGLAGLAIVIVGKLLGVIG